MASCFFLLKQFEDVNIYLNSVKVMFLLWYLFSLCWLHPVCTHLLAGANSEDLTQVSLNPNTKLFVVRRLNVCPSEHDVAL